MAPSRSKILTVALKFVFLLLLAALAGRAHASDITTRLLGTWPGHLRGEAHSIVMDQGFAFVGLRGPGLLILDVRDPARPSLVTDLDLGGSVDGMAISGTRLFLHNSRLGLQILDITDRTHPSVISTLQTGPAERPFEFFTHVGGNVAVFEQHVLIADGKQGVKIFDVSDPTHPTFLSELPVPDIEGMEAVSVKVSEDYAYVGCGYGGLWVIDISDPAVPLHVATVPPTEPGLFVQHVAVSGDMAFFTDQRNLVVVDVSNPREPMILASLIDDFADHLALFGTTACVRTHDGAQLLDITNPAMPKLQGVISEIIGAIHMVDGQLFGADLRGVAIVDTSVPEEPKRVGGITTAGGVSRFKVMNGHAYVTGGAESGLEILDVRNPARPTSIAQVGPVFAHDLAISGNHLYLQTHGIQVVDISQPNQPKHVGVVSDIIPVRIVASDNALYALLPPIGQMRLAVLTLDNPGAPLLAGSTALQGVPFFVDLEAYENHVYLIGPGQIWVMDVSVPSQPRREHVVSVPASLTGITIHGNHAYVTTYAAGLWIYDLSDPARPVMVGNTPIASVARSVAFSGGYAYVMDDNNRIHLVDVSDPATPQLLGQVAVQSGHLTVGEGRIFVGVGGRGLLIYSDPLAILFSQSVRRESGGVRMTLQGPAGRAFEIQRTRNFLQWETWAQGVFGDSAADGMEFMDEAAISDPFLFYRARLQ